MAWDISWLWNTISAIGTAISSFFSSVQETVSQITNTGQGLFQGLVAFASALWDALIKAFSILGEWVSDAFSWIYSGYKYLSDVFGQWISTAFNWIGSGLNWIAQNIFNVGQWIWNAISFAYDVVRNVMLGVWNWITATLNGIANAISGWWGNIIGGVNAWFTNLLKVFRQKIVSTIMADISIAGMWKAGERMLNPSSLKDLGYSALGFALSPIVGYAIGKFVDAIVPLPSTEPYPLIPSITGFEYTPPSMDITRPSEPTPPYVGVPPTPPSTGAGLPYDVTIKFPTTKVDYTTRTIDKTPPLPSIAYTQTIESTDRELSLINVDVAQLFEYYNTGDDLNAYAFGSWLAGQTFTVGASGHYVKSLRLKLYRTGNPRQVKIGIKAVSEGVPVGDYLTSVTIDGSTLPTSADWVEIVLPPCLLNASTMYAIIIEAPEGDTDNRVYWRTDSTDPTYADGYRVWSNDGGSTWNIDETSDNLFEVWGLP